jgi:hypothetical protein
MAKTIFEIGYCYPSCNEKHLSVLIKTHTLEEAIDYYKSTVMKNNYEGNYFEDFLKTIEIFGEEYPSKNKVIEI